MRKAESSAWTATIPMASRAESTANAFTDALAKQEADLEQARAAGDERAVRKLEQSIESTRALLEAAHPESPNSDTGQPHTSSSVGCSPHLR